MSDIATLTNQEKMDRALSFLEAQADEWAASFDLPATIKNIVSVSRLTPIAPDEDREKFIARQEAAIDTWIRQAFIEGAYRGCIGAFDSVRIGYDPAALKDTTNDG